MIFFLRYNLNKENQSQQNNYEENPENPSFKEFATNNLVVFNADFPKQKKNALSKEQTLENEKLAEKFTFFFSAKTNLLEEIAKFRAARAIWAKILKNKFNFTSPKSLQMRIHAQTAGSQLCAFGIENNQARVTIQALAAIFGGVQSLHTNSYNEALSLPTENSSKLAINIQHVIKEETDITFAPDPMRGSYVVENLTSKMELEVLDIIQNIENFGGVINAIESGYQRSLIENSSYKEAKDLADNKKKIVGLNIGAMLNDDDLGKNAYFTQGKNTSTSSVNIAASMITTLIVFSNLIFCKSE
jgi:methylmalonyl-CoA mutase cobalamin-binding domain/chain